MNDLIIATSNTGKFREIVTLLSGDFENFYSLNDLGNNLAVDEDSPHYSENAMKKARKIGDHFGMATIADDSGLEVAALGGRPGIASARYGTDDEDRIRKILCELKGVSRENRDAVFKAYLAFYLPDKERNYIFFGHLKGMIGTEKHGTGGFGYDPVFFVPKLGKFLAEISTEEKNRISHRGKALRSLKAFLKNHKGC